MRTIYLICCLLFAMGCGNKVANEREAVSNTGNDSTIVFTPEQLKNAALGFGKIEEKKMASILKFNGKIDVPPQNMVSISVPLGGYLKHTKLLPGMHVNRGEIIAVIEDQQYIQLQQEYLLTKSKLAFHKLEYDRQKELNSNKATSDKVFEQVSSEYSSLKIALNALTEKIKLIGKNPALIADGNISRSINVYAPIDGFVSKVNVNIGKYISPTDVLFELVNPADIHLAINVFEKDLSKLSIGQHVIAYTNNEPEKKHLAEILLIGKNLGEDRSTEIHCHFEDYDKSLIPGTYMNADVQVKATDSFVLPEEAVVRFENKHYIFTKKGDLSFEMNLVNVGGIEKGFIEILNGRDFVGKTCVTKGAYTLLMSLKNTAEEE